MPGPDTAPAPRRRARVAVVVAGALAVGGAVVVADVAQAPRAAAASLQPFGSCEELLSWYRTTALEQVGPYGFGGGMVAFADDTMGGAEVAQEAAGAPAAAADGASRTGEAVGSSATGTNVQEAGVDEASPLKLLGPDGGTAVALSGDEVVLVDTAAGTVVGRVRLPGGPAQAGADPGADGAADLSLPAPEGRWYSDLLLVDDRLVVLGSASLPVDDAAAATGAAEGATEDGAEGRVAPDVMPWLPVETTTTATTVDVSDPAAPRVLDVVELEGSAVSARASDGVVRLVTSAQPLLPFTDPWRVAEDADAPDAWREPTSDGQPPQAVLDEAERRNRAVVEEAGLAEWLPEVVTREADGALQERTPVDCASVNHPAEAAGLGTLTVLTLDPATGSTATTSVSADGSFVHATPERLYVATTRGGWLWPVDGPGWGRPWGWQEETTTQLHGFDTSDPRGAEYLGSGEVEGWLLGQWAMDATDGRLRVGTTSERPGPAGDPTAGGGAPATSSSVVVLEERSGGLAEVGRVDGLGPGEQIRSLRWFDDLAVVVTFRQTDPLYTVDLADPTAPRVLGELKVTGYSGYLHPVGDGVLLGVGQEGDEQGVLEGAKVETYDVRDLAAPTDVDRVVWAGSASPVEQDSRRFAYLPDVRTAVLPLERWEGEYSTGLVAVEVGPDGSLAETGSWTTPDAGYVGALAAAGDRVLVSDERWSTEPDAVAPQRVLTVLDARTLEVLAEVTLG